MMHKMENYTENQYPRNLFLLTESSTIIQNHTVTRIWPSLKSAVLENRDNLSWNYSLFVRGKNRLPRK